MGYKAFVSSTFKDLEKHRAFVIQALRKSGFSVDPMEDWTASTGEPQAFSRERLAGCDLGVLLVALRRGYVPDGETLSITELEYQAAVSRNIDVLVFLLDEKAPWPREYDELDIDPRLRAWREKLMESRSVGFFGLDPSTIEIAPALTRWLAEREANDFVSERDIHEAFTRSIAAWPPAEAASEWRRGYVLRHGLYHRTSSGVSPDDMLEDLDFLSERFRMGTLASVAFETNLSPPKPKELAESFGELDGRLDLDVEDFPELLYNGLVARGLDETAIHEALDFKAQEPEIRLRFLTGEHKDELPEEFLGYGELVGARMMDVGEFHPAVLAWTSDGRLYHLHPTFEAAAVYAHDAPIRDVLVLQEEKLALTCSDDFSIKVWNLEGGLELRYDWGGHRDAVLGLRAHPDRMTVMSFSADGTLRQWVIETGRILRVLDGQAAAVTCCAISPDGSRVFSGSASGDVQLWDLSTGDRRVLPNGNTTEAITTCSFSPNGDVIVAGDSGGRLHIWYLSGTNPYRKVVAHRLPIQNTLITNDGLLVSSSGASRVTVHDVSGGSLRSTLEHEAPVTGVFPFSSELATTTRDRGIHLWDRSLWERKGSFRGRHHEPVLDTWIERTGEQLWSFSSDRTLRVWSLGAPETANPDFVNPVRSLAPSPRDFPPPLVLPSGNAVLHSRSQSLIRIALDTGESNAIRSSGPIPHAMALSGSEEGVEPVLFVSDAGVQWGVLVGSPRAELESASQASMVAGISLDFETIWEDLSGPAKGCAAHPESPYVLIWPAAPIVEVRSRDSGKILRALEGHTAPIEGARLGFDLSPGASPGSGAVTYSRDTTLRIWDLSTQVLLHVLEGHTDWVLGCSVNAPESEIASWGADRTLRIWDIASGRETMCYELPADITACARGRDRLAVGLSNGEVHFFGSDPPAPIRAHGERVTGLRFLDGALVSCSEDGTLRGWTEIGDRIGTAHARAPFVHLDATPDGRSVIALDNRDSLWCFQLDWLARTGAAP